MSRPFRFPFPNHSTQASFYFSQLLDDQLSPVEYESLTFAVQLEFRDLVKVLIIATDENPLQLRQDVQALYRFPELPILAVRDVQDLVVHLEGYNYGDACGVLTAMKATGGVQKVHVQI